MTTSNESYPESSNEMSIENAEGNVPSSVRIPTPNLLSVNEFHASNARKAVKELRIQDEFDPRSEREFDDTLRGWEARLKAYGYSEETLKWIILRMSSERVMDVIVENEANVLPCQEFIDLIARKLYPTSREAEIVGRILLNPTRGQNADECIRAYGKLMKYHARLGRRWGIPDTFGQSQFKTGLIASLPEKIAEGILDKGWRKMTYKELVECVYEVDESIQRKQELRPQQTTLAPVTTSNSINRRITETPLALSTCHRCNTQGHKRATCRVPCPHCGRIGHDFDRCYKLMDGAGLQPTVFARKSKHGMKVEVREAASYEEMMRKLKDWYKMQEAKANLINSKQKEKRRIERETRTAGVDIDNAPYLAQTVTSDTSNRVDINETKTDDRTMGYHLAALQPIPPRYLNVEVEGYSKPFLVDTGADSSVISKTTLEELERSGVIINMQKPNIGEINVLGGGGRCKIIAEVELSIKIGHAYILETFWIVDRGELDILGNSFLRNTQANIDCKENRIYINDEWHELKDKQSGTFEVYPIQEAIEENETKDIESIIDVNVDHSTREATLALFKNYQQCWKSTQIGKCKVEEHRIDTGSAKPVAQRARALNPEMNKEVHRQFEELMANGAVKKVTGSPWASPIVCVQKKTGEIRVCVDYRKLNTVTISDHFPLPRIDTLLWSLSGSKVFSSLDLKSGYYQIRVAEEDQLKTVAVTPYGQYAFTVMPFGLKNAPSTFQRVMTTVLSAMINNGVLVYIDDIIIYSKNAEEHLLLLKSVLEALTNANLYINVKKSLLMKSSITYLGVIIDEKGLHPDPAKLEALRIKETPQNTHELRQFLGLAGYMRAFIHDFGRRSAPLMALLKQGAVWDWNPECATAFEDLKITLLTNPVILTLPLEDREFILDTDASLQGGAAILQQRDDNGRLRVVCYASRKWSDTEMKWPIRELEAFIIVWAITKFSAYVRCKPFIVRTDHESLKWMWKTDNRRIARWCLALSEYDFKIEYVKGKDQNHVDYFTRSVKHEFLDDVFDDRMLLRANLFALQLKPMISPLDLRPPSLEEVKERTRIELINCPKQCYYREGLYVTEKGRVFVPPTLRSQVIVYFHCGRASAHQGVGRTYNRIKHMFYWPFMKKDIEIALRKCQICARRRTIPTSMLQGNHIVVGLFRVVAIDVVGPFYYNNKSVRILTMIDHATRFPMAIELVDLTSECTWNAFYENWVCLFGAPTHLLTDNGSNFRGQYFQQQCASIGIQKLYSTPYHPQGNAIIESFHQYLKRAMSAVAAQDHSLSLNSLLQTILFAYRSTPHPTLGEMPFKLITGMDMIIPGLQEWVTPEFRTREQRMHALEFSRFIALEATVDSVLKRNKDRKTVVFEKGDIVVLKRNYRAGVVNMNENAVFLPKWSPPMRVIKIKGSEDNVLELVDLVNPNIKRQANVSDVIKIDIATSNEFYYLNQLDLINDFRKHKHPENEEILQNEVEKRRKQMFGDLNLVPEPSRRKRYRTMNEAIYQNEVLHELQELKGSPTISVTRLPEGPYEDSIINVDD